MKTILILLVVAYTASTVVDGSGVYQSQPMQMFTNYTCTPDSTSGGTPLGFQCIKMTYPGATTDINNYPCFTVNGVSGRHIEVLIEPVNPIAQVRTCIREEGFSEQCATGVHNYCKRVQTNGTSTIIRIFCVSGGCETSAVLLWYRIELSPSGQDAENWCLTRTQATPSSLFVVLPPINQTDQDDNDTNSSTVVNDSRVYQSQPMQMFTNYTCTPDSTSGGTPLGFQCIEMTYPEATTNINEYPHFTVNNVSGRYIEVLIEPANSTAQVRTCIREDDFSEQCATGVNNYCKRVQTDGNSTVIHIFCLSGGCETSAVLLWYRIELSPSDQDAENWCLNRSQATPSSLNNVQDTNPGGFVVLQPVSAASLFLIVMLIKLLF